MQHLTVHLRLTAVAAIWGVGWVAGRVLAQEIPTFTAAWLRYLVAVLAFIAWLASTGRFTLPNRREWRIVGFVGFFSTFLYQVFFMLGMERTAAGDASLMITFNPLFTAILAIFFLDEKMTKRLGTGSILAIAGVVILFLRSPNIDIPAGTRMLGDLFVMLAALSWSASAIAMKRGMTTAPEGEMPMSPLRITVWSSITGLAFLTPGFIWEGASSQWAVPSTEALAAILFLAILSTVVSYVWYADGIRTIGAGPAALYVYLVPLFGILSGWILLDEKLGWSLLLAFALIVGGVAFAQSEKGDERAMLVE